ncbi:MAG: disulfide bond formation protein B [Rhizobiaceae bacterium]|nr:disulfide bond formation protein B [Rhizobiaceae bacterium]
MNTISNAPKWQQSGKVQVRSAAFVLIGMIVVVGSALGFEHLGGYVPCALCLEQRVPYYWAIPLLAIGFLSAINHWSPLLTRGLLVAALICLLYTAWLGAYHSGVEWGYFEAPQSCGAGLSATTSDAGSLMDSLATSKPPSCDEAAGRFLGISFAGWNFIAAMLLAAVALRGAFGKAD